MSQGRWGGTGVLLNGKTGKLLVVGGGDPTTDTSEIFDPGVGQWQSIAPMTRNRHHADLVLLPDGNVLAVGGQSTHVFEGEGDVRKAEILDPEQNRWESAGFARYGHGYHSSALLLPDGNVLAAGPLNTLEIYHPWYDAVENRPVITNVPESVGYQETFTLTANDGSDILKIVLIRTSSVTHSLNTDQRYLELDFEQNSTDELSVASPESPGMAPPGYYLLFVLNGENVPSKGEFLRIG